MERELTDVNTDSFSENEINEMEEQRVQSLNEAGIDEEFVIDRSNKNNNQWVGYFNENLVRGKDDVNFLIRDQWTAVERSEFSRLFRTPMTRNKLYDIVKKIVGEQRKNKPDLIVRSRTGKASQKEIDLRSDLVRTISYKSQNDLIYQTAFKSALSLGFGAFQVGLAYKSARSFDHDIVYDLVTDVSLCSWDSTALKPHKGDGNFCSRRYLYTRDEFFATYPYVTNPISYVDPYMLIDLQYQTRETIVVCDEFVKEWYPLVIYHLSNGMVVSEKEWEDAQEVYKKQKEVVKGSKVEKIIENGMPKIVNRRQTQDYKIMHYRMLRNQIIEFSEWPSKYLPLIFVDGDSYYIEGRQYTKSLIHDARDAQKLHNYALSEAATDLKNRRREQWLGTPDNIQGYEQEWRNPEVQVGILRAKPDPKTGMMPMRQPAWEMPQSLLLVGQMTGQDIREITGFSEAEEVNARDISGKARRERKMEISMSSYVFFDNLNQAIEQSGRIVNDLLKFIIGDEQQDFVITKKDGRSEPITLNKMVDNKLTNTLTDGDFDVEIDTGPSFAVQKEIALEFFQQTIQNNPQVFNLIADLWASNLDIQQMQQVKDRLKNLVPPQILAQEEGKQLPPQPPSPQQQMMQAELQLKKSQIQERAAELAIRQKKHELEEAELSLEAQKMRMDYDIKTKQHHLDVVKSDNDFTSNIARILSDHHSKSLNALSQENSEPSGSFS